MILYVLRYWPTLTETFAHAEIGGLAGVELAAFGAREGDDTNPPAPVHSPPHRIGWLPLLPVLFLEWLRRPALVSRRVLWLTTLVRRARRVHIHFAGEAAVWAREACARAAVPYGVTVHAVDLWKPHPELPGVLRDAALVVTVSEVGRRALAAHGVDAVVVRCGVELAEPSRRQVVLCVGRNLPKKGLDVVVEAARRLPGLRFVLVSDLPDPGLPNLEVTGLLPHSEVLHWIGRARVLLLPCRVAPDGDRDNIPVVLMEALAASVPVVTTELAGIPELVDDTVGWLVPPDDPDAVVAALGASDAEQCRRGARGPDRLRDRGFIRDEQIAKMASLLQTTVLGVSRPAG